MATDKPETTDAWTLTEAILAVIGALRLPHVLLWGPPATGKTHAAVHASRPAEQKVYSVTLTQEMPAYELRGFERPVGKGFKWSDGPVVAALRSGGRLVLNEIHRASADVMSFLLSVLDDRDLKSVTLPTGEVVTAAPGFCVVATSNNDPADLDEALASRFPVVIQIDTIHPAALATLPADLRQAAVGMAQASSDRRITIRAWQAYATLRGTISSAQAAAAVFGVQAEDVLASLAIASADTEE